MVRYDILSSRRLNLYPLCLRETIIMLNVGVQLPSTAGQSFIQISPVDLLVNRMNVQGRPQDLGHVPVESEMPPPNYDQATEP